MLVNLINKIKIKNIRAYDSGRRPTSVRTKSLRKFLTKKNPRKNVLPVKQFCTSTKVIFLTD